MFHELVRSARTIRRFDESTPVGEEVLRRLVDIARMVPCGGNSQPLRYRINHTAEDCACIFPHLSWAGALKEWDGPAPGERPTGYILVLAAGSPSTNVGIAAQTIQLAATSLGLGACMMGAIDREAIHEALKLPEELKIQLVIALGKPSERVVLEERSLGADLNYYRSEDGVHHVPKLRLDDILV